MRRFSLLAVLFLVAACAAPRVTPPVTPPPPVQPVPAITPPETAAAIGVSAAPALAALSGWQDADPADLDTARRTFARSCPILLRRADQSGLTQPADWTAACADAATAADARRFFQTHFTPVRVADGMGLNTGYFEPEIAGSRVRAPGFDVPVLARPTDLVDVDLGLFSDSLKGKRIRGRVEGQALRPYPDRGAIEDGALGPVARPIAWASDPYEFFFLQIQGSGRLRLPDGSIMRIGYDSQNGRDYTGIGKLLRARGLLAPGQATMDGIIAWLRANPDQGRALMRENKSYVFFRELTGDGPLGALNVAVTPEVTVAADPKFVPLGAPLWLETTIAENGSYRPRTSMWVAQDTGGAIKGANRFDLFWGPGARARAIAGALSAQGRATLLLPHAAAARLLAARNDAPAQ